MTPRADPPPGADSVERTPDGRYIVVAGRRWRASDPHIPAPLRQELVDELMAARRAVRGNEPHARERVHDAKVALGERGPTWWDPLDAAARAERMRATLLALARHREGSALHPSDVARVVGGPGERWRAGVAQVREVAAALAEEGAIVATQGDAEVDPRRARGPVRLRIARGNADEGKTDGGATHNR